MKRINLIWYGPYCVADLSEILKQSVSVSDEKYPALNDYGFYMFLEKNLSQVLYIGQAFKDNPRALRDRIRWEIIKDDLQGTQSKFFKDCNKFGIDKLSLILKVAHIKDTRYNEKQIVHDPKLMNDIEMALIHEIKPLFNKKGKQRYRRESIEIFNSGNFIPLPKTIKKYQFISAARASRSERPVERGESEYYETS